MSRRFDFGVASYGNPAKLRGTLQSVCSMSTTDYRCFVVHNPGGEGDEQARAIIREYAAANGRIQPIWMDVNAGYAGAVNKLFEHAETEYIGYLDNDVKIITPGWDEHLCQYLDRFHEIGVIHPGGGHYPIPNGRYTEVLWAAGYCWATPRLVISAVGPMDTTIGHHEEVDWNTRMRLAGYVCAVAPNVVVQHAESATSNPQAQERINRGVVAWMNKWTAYFGGKALTYHSPNVIRVSDWNINALYMERYFMQHVPQLNADPPKVTIDGVRYDLILVPRPEGFYAHRII